MSQVQAEFLDALKSMRRLIALILGECPPEDARYQEALAIAKRFSISVEDLI